MTNFSLQISYFLFLLVQMSQTCIPSELNLPPPIVHEECLNRSFACKAGYYCGPYGCTKRRRALGANTLSVMDSDPNSRFEKCCVMNMLPHRCLKYCSYEDYGPQAVSNSISNQFDCPLAALPVVHKCAAQKKDHRKCCQKNFVPDECLQYCAPSLQENMGLEPSKLFCLQYLNTFKQCFMENTK